MVVNDVGDQRRRDCRTESNTRKNQSIREATLLRGNPRGHEPVAGWIDNRFTHSEQEAHSQQNRQRSPEVCRRQRRERCEDRPPECSCKEDSSWSEMIRKTSAWRLE